jgi:hypothetical protein
VTALTGRCLCGAVRYACGAPLYAATLCHCASCRRAQGAHAIAWFTVARDSLTFTATEPRVFRSSPGVERAFCAQCGTPISYRNVARPEEIDLTICSLEQPASVAPADHIWMDDALQWDRPGDGLALHAATRKR